MNNLRRNVALPTVLTLLLCGSLFAAPQARAESGLAVADGLKVSIEYTLTLPDKSVAESNVGEAPFSYIQGAQQVVPGLEKGLAGLKAGQTKRVNVPAEQGYGVYDDKRRIKVPRNKIPSEAKVGSMLMDRSGRPVKVLELTNDSATLDLNHPLAGKALTFDVKILNVEKVEPPAQEGKESKKP